MAGLPDASQRLESSVSSDLLYHMALLQTWQRLWRRAGAAQLWIRTVWAEREEKEPEPYI